MGKDKSFLTAREIANELNMSREWVYKKAQARIIPHVRIGGTVRFIRSDVENWIESHKVKGAQKV